MGCFAVLPGLKAEMGITAHVQLTTTGSGSDGTRQGQTEQRQDRERDNEDDHVCSFVLAL
jgi:hypothetical protein